MPSLVPQKPSLSIPFVPWKTEFRLPIIKEMLGSPPFVFSYAESLVSELIHARFFAFLSNHRPIAFIRSTLLLYRSKIPKVIIDLVEEGVRVSRSPLSEPPAKFQ